MRRQAVRQNAVIGVLLALLGFAIATQVTSRANTDTLGGLREEDLLGILDDQQGRADQLRTQISELEATLRQLEASGDRSTVAREQTRKQAEALGVVLGTLPATGPGVQVTITDPFHRLKAEDLLNVVQELRGAGAEAIQFGAVRIGTNSSFGDTPDGGVQVDGARLTGAYEVRAIGDPKTMDTALNIPGGVAAVARAAGGTATVVEQQNIAITAVRALPQATHAKPAGR